MTVESATAKADAACREPFLNFADLGYDIIVHIFVDEFILSTQLLYCTAEWFGSGVYHCRSSLQGLSLLDLGFNAIDQLLLKGFFFSKQFLDDAAQ